MTFTTFSNEGPVCPYCRAQFTADEAFYFDEMSYTEDECGSCGKKFKVEVCTITSWECGAITEAESE